MPSLSSLPCCSFYAAIGVSVSPLQQLVYLFRYIMPGVSHKEVLQYSTASLILTNKLRAYDVYWVVFIDYVSGLDFYNVLGVSVSVLVSMTVLTSQHTCSAWCFCFSVRGNASSMHSSYIVVS
jgi:hypothetical protein